MFLVRDTIDDRHARIRAFLPDNPSAAVLFAAADFEWTLRRAIFRLGSSNTKDMREKVLRKLSGLERYNAAWKREITPRLGRELNELIPEWEKFKENYGLRNELIHGARGGTSARYATECIERILAGSRTIATFAAEHNEPVYGKRLPIRRTSRS